jgi:hypothetical protein
VSAAVAFAAEYVRPSTSRFSWRFVDFPFEALVDVSWTDGATHTTRVELGIEPGIHGCMVTVWGAELPAEVETALIADVERFFDRRIDADEPRWMEVV